MQIQQFIREKKNNFEINYVVRFSMPPRYPLYIVIDIKFQITNNAQKQNTQPNICNKITGKREVGGSTFVPF